MTVSAPLCVVQVKEGHDSTVRPKLASYEFDQGKLYKDEWAADGKPYLSRYAQGRVRAAKIFGCVSVSVCSVLLFGRLDGGEDHVFTTLQRPIYRWFNAFIKFDRYEEAKARSVGWPLPDPTAVRVKPSPRIFRQPDL